MRKRTAQIVIYLTDEQREILATAAQGMGEDIGTFAASAIVERVARVLDAMTLANELAGPCDCAACKASSDPYTCDRRDAKTDRPPSMN